MEIKPIAYIKTNFKEKFGIPRQSGIVNEIKGEIVFEKQFRNPDALRGIEEYSHLWLIFDFSKNHRDNFKEYKIDVLYDENTFKNIDDNTKNQIIKIIEQDPKPAYKQDKKEYKFLFSDYEICFEISENTAKIIEINKMQL